MLFMEIGAVPTVVFFQIFSNLNNWFLNLVSLTQSLGTYDTSNDGNILSLFHVKTETKIVMTVLIGETSVYTDKFRKLTVDNIISFVKHIFLETHLWLDWLT